jgi:hypothetical protein
MRQIAFAQLSAEWRRLPVSHGVAINPHNRQKIDDCARQKSLARRLRLSHRERSLDNAAALTADDIEGRKAGDAVKDWTVGLTGYDSGILCHHSRWRYTSKIAAINSLMA